eukprot:m.130407 g.130407  ORF g.130407 m.130407 type:complete len:439 (+) comp9468_c0_seq9:65-1381(+)
MKLVLGWKIDSITKLRLYFHSFILFFGHTSTLFQFSNNQRPSSVTMTDQNNKTTLVSKKVKANKLDGRESLSFQSIIEKNPTFQALYSKKNPPSLQDTMIVQASIDDLGTKTIGKKDVHLFQCPKGFVGAATYAYNQHHHLILRPDDVWQAILAQFSLYVQTHAEELRDVFVNFEGKKTLEIVARGTLFTADFGRMAERMVDEQIMANIADPSIAQWLLPDFSTTTTADRIAASVTQMATLQSYFDYVFALRCGLPSITLLGTVEDWEAVRTRIERLPEFETNATQYMQKWFDMLVPVLDEFVNTKKGAKNMDSFWDHICHYEGGGSGPTFLAGWITVFAVFGNEGKWQGSTFETQTMEGKIKSKWPLIDTNKITSGVISVPVLVDDNGIKYNTHMFAGHFSFVGKSCSVIPRPDWCLVMTREEYDTVQKGIKMEHKK